MKHKPGLIWKFWFAGFLVAGAVQLAWAGPFDDPNLQDELDLVLPFYGPACPPPPPPMQSGPGGLHGDGMHLGAAQNDKVFAIRYAALPKLREQARAIGAALVSLRDLALSSGLDEARLKSLSEAAARSMAAQLELQVRIEHRIYELLTPEQRKRFSNPAPGTGADQPVLQRPWPPLPERGG